MPRTFRYQQHQKQVLHVGLAGALRPLEGAKLQARVREATLERDCRSFDELARINAFLLWHLAFAPKASDRDACLVIADAFEPRIRASRHLFRNSTAEPLFYPIPFSPAFSLVDLASPIPGATLEPTGTVASYRNLKPDPASFRSLPSALNQFKLALGARGRRIISEAGVDALSSHQIDCHALVTLSGNPTEQVAILKLGAAEGVGLCMLFLKNGWPVGYGGAFSEHVEDTIVGINFHMFEEYRGTRSTYTFFRELQAQATRLFRNADLLAVYFNAPTASLRFRPGPEAAFIRFLRRSGFSSYSFLPPNALYKRVR
jgi:hypothetical protein